MRASRAVAGLLLLALFLGTTQAGDKCANCGLGEGVDACNCGNSVVRSEKLEKPEIFASPESIKNALNLKAASANAARQTAPIYILPTATYAVPAGTYGAAYNAVPAPSPVSYASLSPLRGKSHAENKCRNTSASCANRAKHSTDNEDLVSLLSLKPGTSVAPKFEPIGDLCRCNKCKYGNGDGVVGVVPARPGKLPPYKPRKPKSKSTTTPTPLPTHATQSPTLAYPTAAYGALGLSYGAPAPSYRVPTASYAPSAPSYSAPASSLSYGAPAAAQSYVAPEAPSFSVPASFYSAHAAGTQYAPAYRTAYSAAAPASPTLVTAPHTPDSAQYAPTYSRQSPSMMYVVGDAPTPSANEACEKTKAELEYQKDYEREGAITPILFTPDLAQYAPTHPRQSGQMMMYASRTPAAPAEYVPTYQQSASPAPAGYAAGTASPAEEAGKKSKKQVDYEKDEQEAQTLVEIQLPKERAPRYTADPVSVSMAYKFLADSQGKKYVPEDRLAYGHYKEPADGRVNKCVSDFDEEKLHTVDKPVVELKDDDYGNLQISYRDIGFGPVAPSKNRFVPKTDDASNLSHGPTIIYVPPPEDKDGLPCGPLGPTIPGYKPGGVIHGEPSAKSTCACGGKTSPVREATRRAVLVDADEQNGASEEHEGDSDKGGIIERIKSSSCKCKKPQ